jgi:hypothetical protein
MLMELLKLPIGLKNDLRMRLNIELMQLKLLLLLDSKKFVKLRVQ